MNYRQLNAEERSALAALRRRGLEPGGDCWRTWAASEHGGAGAKRNAAPYDGWYRAGRAEERAVARRKRSRRNSQFGREAMGRVEELLKEEWSPEQVSGHLWLSGELAISHETIYRHVWQDLKSGGTLHLHLRGARKQCRKRYGRSRQPGTTGRQANDWGCDPPQWKGERGAGIGRSTP